MKVIFPIAGNSNDYTKEFNTKKELVKIDKYNFLQSVINIYDNKKISEILIILKKNDFIKYNFKKILFSKNCKISFIISHISTANQIETLRLIKNKINKNESVLIVNPDSFYKFTTSDFISLKKIKADASIGYILPKFKKFLTGKKESFFSDREKVIKVQKRKDIDTITSNHITSGIYYFRKWKYISEYFQKNYISKNRITTAIGIYDFLIKNKKNIACFVTNNFVDLGTPKKLREYLFWKKYFNKKKHTNLKINKLQNIIPSAGLGSRHKKLGYLKPKPFIKVSNKFMIEKSFENLPKGYKNIFIFRKKIVDNFKINKSKFQNIKDLEIVSIKNKTKGMAITISRANKIINDDWPVIVSSCDFTCILNQYELKKLINTHNPEAIIFTWKGYPYASESPFSHAYVNVKENFVRNISEKIPISKTPDEDNAVTGMFYFKTGKIMKECTSHMLKNKITVNGEYYTATSMLKILRDNKNVMSFMVDQFISWSLPEHLETYVFWEKFFKDK